MTFSFVWKTPRSVGGHRGSAQSAILMLLVGALATQSGCVTLARQAISEVRGAQGDVLPIGSTFAAPQSGSIRAAPATSSVGPPIVPASLLRQWDLIAEEILVTPGAGASAAGELLIETDFLYFSEKGLLDQAMCLARVRMMRDGKPVGDVMLLAESKSFRAGDDRALARAAAEALRKYLRRE